MLRFFQRLRTPSLVGLALVAATLPKAHGQSRSMHLRPSFLTRPFISNRTTIPRTTPFRTTIPRTTPFRTTIPRTTPFFSPRDLRFDPFLRRDLRFDRFLGAGSAGFLGAAGTSFGVGDPGGGVIAGSGLTPYPVPYPVYANPYDFTNLYDLSGGPAGTNRSDRSSAEETSPMPAP
jgi:hypothetical protein